MERGSAVALQGTMTVTWEGVRVFRDGWDSVAPERVPKIIVSLRTKRAFEPAGRASAPAERALDLAGRTFERAGRAHEKAGRVLDPAG